MKRVKPLLVERTPYAITYHYSHRMMFVGSRHPGRRVRTYCRFPGCNFGDTYETWQEARAEADDHLIFMHGPELCGVGACFADRAIRRQAAKVKVA